MKRGERMIFIGGAPRSGTTLVQNILDSHPDICGSPEFLHIPDIVSLRRALHVSIDREWIDIICSRDDVDKQLSTLIVNLLLPLADKYQRKFLSEKTPENILVFTELMDLLPDAKFIHVVRDPRSIVSSMQEVRKRAVQKGVPPPSYSVNISSGIAYVKKCFESGFHASKFVTDKVFTVVYERLVVNPEHETKKVCEFLGIQWVEDMLHPADMNHLGEKAITSKSSEVFYDAGSYYRNPHLESIHKWKTQLSLAQKIKITKAFRDSGELRNLGYDFRSQTLTDKEKIWGVHVIRLMEHFQDAYEFIRRKFKLFVRRMPGILRIRRFILHYSNSDIK